MDRPVILSDSTRSNVVEKERLNVDTLVEKERLNVDNAVVESAWCFACSACAASACGVQLAMLSTGALLESGGSEL